MQNLITELDVRIAELETERDAFIQQANAQVGAFNGGIGELKRYRDSLKAKQEAQ